MSEMSQTDTTKNPVPSDTGDHKDDMWIEYGTKLINLFLGLIHTLIQMFYMTWYALTTISTLACVPYYGEILW